MPESPQVGLRKSLTNSGFFVLRSPLLPIDELISWSEGLEAGSTFDAAADPADIEKRLAIDVEMLRSRLRTILDRSEIVHALHVASPSLRSGLDHWIRNPDSKKGLQAERAVVRYFERMCTRPTPFGLFSGCSVGRIGGNVEGTALVLEPRANYRTSTRLDFDYLFALSGALRRDPALIGELTYWPNSSLRRVASAWHYTESRLHGAARSHHLVKLEDDAFLDAALQRAEQGASVAELVRTMIATGGDEPPSEEEARDFILDLIRSDVLVPPLTPLVTGEPALDDLARQLASLPSGGEVATTLDQVRQALAALDEQGLGSSIQTYETIATRLRVLPVDVDPAKLYQVDMRKPAADARLGSAVMDEVVHATELLVRFGQPREAELLAAFRDAFAQRYDQAMVPVLEALDEETGVPFGAAPGDDAPLLRGLGQAAAEAAQASHRDVNGVLLRKLALRARGDVREIELTEDELPPLPATHTLPDSFCLLATLIGSPAAVESGEFQLLLRGGFGPSGARMFGRFCHADPELDACVRVHLRQEELQDPDAVYAEIVYVPEGRVGNVISRPRFREYEIPYLGRSGAPLDRQLPLSDLLIGIENESLVLRSRRLGRRVVPRLTNAHGFMNSTLPAVYRLLCHLQHQGRKNVPGFSWGTLEGLEFLPRVRVGRVVISVARWKLEKDELAPLTQPGRAQRFLAMQKVRRERGLPRWIVYHEGDNALPADLDNPLSVDAFVDAFKRSTSVTLSEMYPDPATLCARAEEGRFSHELNVPVAITPRATASAAVGSLVGRADLAAAGTVDRGLRTLPPGSEWLYVKLYGGRVVLDEVLTSTFPPLIAAFGDLDRWFFIRYADPQDHLRIRFNGRPRALQRDVLPLVTDALNPLLSAGKIWKIQFDTYEREIERYGGLEGTMIAEDFFFADSTAVLAILQATAGDDGQDTRWRAALYGVDALLADFGLDLAARRIAVGRWRDQLYAGSPGKQQLADRLRSERRRLEEMLWYPRSPDGSMAVVRAAFVDRSTRMASVVERLGSLSSAAKLNNSLADVMRSYAHMHVNRMIRAAANMHELVIYDFLARLYEGQIARRHSAKGPPAALPVGAEGVLSPE